MHQTTIHLTAALLLTAATTAGAQTRYLCDAPPTARDARACAAAQQGPAELRRFIQRMQGVEHLLFEDYVNAATRLAWDARHDRPRAERLATGGIIAAAAPAPAPER